MLTSGAEALILWIDAALVVVNKPAGLPSLPDGYDPQAPHLKSVLEPVFGRLWIVHRLDRETSGVMALARSAEAHRSLNGQFEARQVQKVYHALVRGSPPWETKTTRLPLRPDGDRKHRTVVDARRGKEAETEFQVLERLGAYSLVAALPHTGRTHQIRAHLAALGFPILADQLYGGGPALYLSGLASSASTPPENEVPILARAGLHATSLALAHPLNGAPLHFEAPYPADFQATLQTLRDFHP